MCGLSGKGFLSSVKVMCACAAIVALGLLGGCAGAEQCPKWPTTTTILPDTVSPGATLTLQITGLLATCHDTGEGGAIAMKSVRVDLVDSSDTSIVLSTVDSPVNKDGSSTVHLVIPEDAHGDVTLRIPDTGYQLGSTHIT